MKKVLRWEFPTTGGGPDDGIHNPMIEYFVGNYNYSLAREIIQNSIDAKSKKADGPVRVVFRLEHFTQQDFPNLSELQLILEDCRQYWAGNPDTVEFLEKAILCSKQKSIPVLKISDYNTKGLSGNDDDKNSSWYNLIKSRGSSFKTSGEGGSFGIGKGAPFAASDLRTVFYVTQDEKRFNIFQGIAELVSHTNRADNDRKRGVGTFGYGKESVRDLNIELHKFWRKETGTDIYIAGYKIEKNWEEELVKSILRNFWYAIYVNDLQVEVEKIVINQSNIGDTLAKYFLGEDFKDHVKPLGNPLQYYKAVIEGTVFETTLPTAGKVKFWFNEIEDHMNYTAMMRMSHMVIYSKRFHYPGNFSGVFLCDNTDGNRELRKMEPPAHDEWIPERNREKGKKIIEEIEDFVRSCISSMKKTKESGILEIPDLHKYLPFDEGTEDGDNIGNQKYSGQETDEETASKIQKREVFDIPSVISPQKITVINKPSKAGSDDGYRIPTGGGIVKKKKKRGSGDDDGKGMKTYAMKIRTFCTNNTDDEADYKIIIRNVQSIKRGILKLYAVGEEQEEKVEIVDVYDDAKAKYAFTGNKVQNLSLDANSVRTFHVKILTKIKLSLKAELNELQ